MYDIVCVVRTTRCELHCYTMIYTRCLAHDVTTYIAKWYQV